MSDRSATQIEIGGHIADIFQFRAVVRAIFDEGCGPEWEGGCIDCAEVAGVLIDAARGGYVARFFDSDRRGGMFEELETVLRAQGLAYSRADDGCGGVWAAANEAWRPGMDAPLGGFGGTEAGVAILVSQMVGKSPAALAALVADYAEAFTIPPLTIAPEALAQWEREGMGEETTA